MYPVVTTDLPKGDAVVPDDKVVALARSDVVRPVPLGPEVHNAPPLPTPWHFSSQPRRMTRNSAHLAGQCVCIATSCCELIGGGVRLDWTMRGGQGERTLMCL